ncbi:hypothetical protein D1BOALGB6SA_10669 [Olavius sp. associated proteobacterium Delta 1]|nr:hypothetical protein D1BOALGB6SA_10669 [Olavius sp. associated proteobacterium Delta 1]
MLILLNYVESQILRFPQTYQLQIEIIRNPAKLMICSKSALNLSDLWSHISCLIFISTIIEMCGDRL